jgi:uncharacterized repeat protein (TIGR04076 family)
MKGLVITVKDIRGKCTVHKIGDRIMISGPEIDLVQSDRICIHALPSLLHYAVALREGVDPGKLGLASEGDSAFISCPDPGEPYTDGGTVVFEVKRKAD